MFSYWKSVVRLTIFTVFVLSFSQRTVDGGFLITVARQWTLGENTDICVSLTDNAKFGAGDFLKAVITIHASFESTILEPSNVDNQNLNFTQGKSNECVHLAVPKKIKTNLGSYTEVTSLKLDGNLGGNIISETVNVTLFGSAGRTFIQTDKYLYKPGQTVEFRVLSVGGPFLTIQYEPLNLVYVENPSRTRIQQWSNVDNSKGLVHNSFQLSDEVEQGSYRIIVKIGEVETTKTFRVEDYVLPRYEITLKPKSVILATDKSFDIEMCAKYTFGEDVKGIANISVAVGTWRIFANESQSKPISGCTNFTFSTSKLRFDDNNCHIRVSSLSIRGVVREAGTGVELVVEKKNIDVTRKVITFKNQSPEFLAKQYIPRFFKLLANYANGARATNESMEVCTIYLNENICKNFTTCDEGYLTFVAPSDASSRFTVKALKYPKLVKNWNDVMQESKFHIYSFNEEAYVDPSNSSLTIYDKSELKCTNGDPVGAIIPVIYFVRNVASADVFIQVLSRSRVQSSEKMRVDFKRNDLPYKNFDVFIENRKIPADVVGGTFNITLDLTATVSPKLKLLVWFIARDGTVVADRADIDVTNCLPHKVNMNWSVIKAEPGKTVGLSVTAAEKAICSVGIVDKSVELLSNQNNQQMTIVDLLDTLYDYEFKSWRLNPLNLEYCLSKYNGNLDDANRHLSTISEKEKLVYNEDQFRFRSNKEAIHMFIEAGYHVLTDQTVQRQFCYNLIIDAIKREQRRKEQEKNRPPAPPRHQHSSINLKIGGGSGGGFSAPSHSANFAPENRRPVQDSPIAFAQDAHVVQDFIPSAVEEDVERSYLPETWLWKLISVPTSGIWNEQLTIPDTITEWVGRTVCVHTTEGVGISNPSSVVTFTPFFIDLTLPATIKRGEILPLKISVFNYLKEDLPVKLVLVESSGYKTTANVLNVRNRCVRANDKFVETIKMTFLKLGDVNITVEASVDPLSSTCGSGSPSIEKTDRLIRSIPVEAEGILREIAWTKYVCGEDTASNAFSSTIAAPADIVVDSDRGWITATGDLLGPTLTNIGHIVAQPKGCGEQNMVDFAPNVYTRQYMESSGQLTDEIIEQFDFYLKRGYQRQLAYRHRSDGSFSSFGERDSSGSTWLTAFVLKSFDQARNYTFIDEGISQTAARYLNNKQNKSTGCYESEGRVIHKQLQGGLDEASSENVLLSAYVLTALGPSRFSNAEEILKGISCIVNDVSVHPYSLALRAYSLALNNATVADSVITKLLNSATDTGSEMHWDLPEIEKNAALQVETAGYALLALISQNYNKYKEQSRKIVRWISGQRNSRGGFISTQDTVVALEALAAFQKVRPSVEPNLVVKIRSVNLNEKFNIVRENKFLEQRIDMPTVPADVKLSVTGQGCGIVQGVIRYNVLADSTSEAFVLNVNATESGSDCRSRRISACTSYTLSDKKSNMAIVEFKLQTGFTVDKKHLREVLNGDRTGNLKRFEVDGSKVIFYLEEVTAENTCIAFNVHQDVAIENIKVGYVKVYDYYQPEYETTKNYMFPTHLTCNSIIQ